MDDLLQEFIAETRETLEALSGEIVAWEADPTDRARLDAIFRFVHTVKGSCGFLDLPRLARLSHAAEDVLAAVRDGKRIPDTALVNAVLAIVDRIGEIVEAIDSGAALDDSSEDLLIAALAEDARPMVHAQPANMPRTNSRSVRLNVDLLDRMMSGMSEMVLARNELARRLRDEAVDPLVEAALERLSLTVAEMRDTVTRTRMQKIDALFSALPRMVRDTAGELGKQVALSVDGADVELDREMIELMRDPLVHIIRNAVDHGIESPADRKAAGKREAGRLIVSARQSGNQILIEVADDGCGIDVDRLVAKARQQKLVPEADLARMDAAAKLDLIFHPGLSSRDTVTAISGRGVGMDVVRSNIEHIGGRIQLSSQPGRGLTIVIYVPLTLSIMSTIVVGVGDQRFAIARQSVDEILRVRGEAVRIDTIGDAQVATVRGRRLPLVSLGQLLDIAGDGDNNGDSDEAGRTLAIISTRDGDYALAIDHVIDTEELVVKPATPAVMATGVYAGQTLPDSGLPMLLLDGAGIATVAGLRFLRTAAIEEDGVAEDSVEAVPALLFEDLDGQRRALPLAAIDRVEPVSTDAIRLTAGQWRLAIGGALVPLYSAAAIGDRAEVPVLRLTDGTTEIAYAIHEPIEIVQLPAEVAPPRGPGPIAGVVMIDGEQVELLDAHALFAGEARPGSQERLCWLQADGSGWMETFLRPMLEASGYRCVTQPPRDAPADVALTMDDAVIAPAAARNVVRLRRDIVAPPGGSSIYRYDRAGLLDALARAVGDR
ncbi:two-component system chemotaxis sensor kinase CheA [Sphingomonas insulae]|uniref:histidine kinase n=1 Tax=Sphingomonas insulae TaxID=424800 RepID=A0ABP3T5S2_9SPHN|nr:chemotaxis protein CheW [Sphingomonas insulae]NIJ29911.1 two-component system chemotaxis sensor kinase CheA [Sphingomonas insulae]